MVTLRNAELLDVAFLMQNAMNTVDSFSSPSKQFQILDLVITFHENCIKSLKKGIPSDPIIQSPLRRELQELRFQPEAEMDQSYYNMRARILAHFTRLDRIYE